MSHQPETPDTEQLEHAERMRLLNAAIVRLHGFNLAQLRKANVLLAAVALHHRGDDRASEDSGAAA